MAQNPPPFLTPKTEPSPAAAPPGAAAASPILLDSDDDDAAIFADYSAVARSFHAAFPTSNPCSPSRALVPTPRTTHASSPGTIVPHAIADQASAMVVARQQHRHRKPRSGEMVRVSALSADDRRYFRTLVRRTRLTFDSLRLFLSHSADHHRRPDMTAAALMMDANLFLHRDKRIIGPLPGVAVGDIFFYRAELCVLGLHGQVQAGIDSIIASQSETGEPIATSVILSGGYEDDDDSGNVLVYTGQGGKELNSSRMLGAQQLKGGNLALERSLHYGIEVRLIRGVKSDHSPTGKVYVYDGLYHIVDYWLDTGKSGFSVYKYRMVRMQGQEEMGSTVLKLAESIKLNPRLARPRGVLTLDLSLGKENFPIYLFNDIDSESGPMNFEYVAQPLFPARMVEGGGGGGCECEKSCSMECLCIQRNGGEFPYDGSGILLKGKPLVYECGPLCRCPPSCVNRVTQKGIRHPLEIFRSVETDWGVRPLDPIRSGTFICEFCGIPLTEQQVELVSGDGDGLVHPQRFPPRWQEWGDISDVVPEYMPPNFPLVPELRFAIDVSRARNVACYLTDSIRPNLFVQFVLYDHYNVSYPHVMIFALENIPSLTEMCLDYGQFQELAARHAGGSNQVLKLE